MSTKFSRGGVAKAQGTLVTLFAKPASAAAGESVAAVKATSSRLTSPDAEVQAYYDTLPPSEATAHRIAITHLDTSYDVRRTNGFLKWQKARA